jgi:hypothetical protein
MSLAHLHYVHQMMGAMFKRAHVKTRMLLQICKQIVTRLLSSRYQDVFALLVPSCWDKSGTSCYRDDGNTLAANCSNKTIIYRLHVTNCYELVVINSLRADDC